MLGSIPAGCRKGNEGNRSSPQKGRISFQKQAAREEKIPLETEVHAEPPSRGNK
jgi:hypothetical protein